MSTYKTDMKSSSNVKNQAIRNLLRSRLKVAKPLKVSLLVGNLFHSFSSLRQEMFTRVDCSVEIVYIYDFCHLLLLIYVIVKD